MIETYHFPHVLLSIGKNDHDPVINVDNAILEFGFEKYGTVFYGISREEILILIFVF
jgi:hypothetical protein